VDPAIDIISLEAAVTLDGLFQERVRRSPEALAYREFNEPHANWRDYTWAQIAREVARWQAALAQEGLQPGDRVAIMLRNCTSWVIFDQAAMALGLVVVPLYTADRPENVAYILNDCNAKVLLLEGSEQWQQFAPVREQLTGLVRILSLNLAADGGDEPRLRSVGAWLPDEGGELPHVGRDAMALASIVYTSGTTGRPKGVMLSHHNMLRNAHALLQGKMRVRRDDLFLSFLPLSHTFERTCGYYLSIMSGSPTAYARSIPLLAEDLQKIRPTLLISVPRIYERVYAAIRAKLDDGPALRKKLFLLTVDIGWRRFEHAQGRGPWSPSFLLWGVLDHLVAAKIRARLGGRLRAAMSGGAALPPDIARVFVGLGLTVLQGYGMTETSPVICANSPQDNLPASVGTPIAGAQVKLGEKDALLTQGPNVMMGYWNNPEATRAMFTPDGWLNTGDTARIDSAGHVFITGRLKEIIVMSNGEKIPPADIEAAIAREPLFEQVMLIGEGRPYLSVIAVLQPGPWQALAQSHGLDPNAPQSLASKQAQDLVLERIAQQMRGFPGYAQVRRVTLTAEPWTVENGLLTPTMKLRRAKVLDRFAAQLESMYAGH
jgi:long-chain acyl-CoA synthetase